MDAVVVFPAQRNANSQASNATSSWVTARRTATTLGHCDIGLERRREQVAAKGGGAPCVVDRHEARSSLHVNRRSHVLSSLYTALEHGPKSLNIFLFFILSILQSWKHATSMPFMPHEHFHFGLHFFCSETLY